MNNLQHRSKYLVKFYSRAPAGAIADGGVKRYPPDPSQPPIYEKVVRSAGRVPMMHPSVVVMVPVIVLAERLMSRTPGGGRGTDGCGRSPRLCP